MALLLEGGTVITQDAQRRALRGSVRVEGARIVAVGDVRRERGDEVLDCTGKLVLPGFVNLHTHSPMTLLRGYGDDLLLEDWLQRRIWPAEAKLTAELTRAGADLALLEMLLSGTTSFADMYFFTDSIAQASLAAGMRCWAGFPLLDFGTPECPPEQMVPRCEDFVKRWLGHPLVTPVVAPHATYTCGPGTLQQAARISRQHNVLLHTHCSETRGEVYDVQAKHGARPVEQLARNGCLTERTLLAHCGWLTKEEVRSIARAGAGVAHCPVSNLKLATGGTMPLPELLAAGTRVGLGTDGAASNNTLDVVETMKLTALLHKHHRWDPTAIPAQVALDLATRGGADALGRSDLGRLEPGAQADIVVLDAQAARMQPMHDPVSQLVYAARGTDVETVLVQGKVVVRDRIPLTLDAPRVLQRARDAAHRLVS
ncbi:MAG: amidohydrolase [Halobacteriales archaeon]|nr:amidohydrolase [Halobacteriales archaeon]